MKILSVVGARPNFMKVAPLHRAFLSQPGIHSKIVHTGQHYDSQLSDVFIRQLELPQPDYFLNVLSGSPAEQMADIMLKFDVVLRIEQPDWVLVVGDVTSTLACARAAVQRDIRVAHVEAGLRSGDCRMPEEFNRIEVDRIADALFVTEQAGMDNLRREGIAPERVHFVGNVMIDSLVHYRQKSAELNIPACLSVCPKQYVLLTMHRPTNVDTETGLEKLLYLVQAISQHKTVLFPVHPRTRASLTQFDLMDRLVSIPDVRVLEPQGYLEFLNLMEHAAVVITDSGGVQEETTYLNVPCLTFRNSTERPVTVDIGTNQLVADLGSETALRKVLEIIDGRAKIGQVPPLWDGKTAARIAKIMTSLTMETTPELRLIA